MPSHVLIFYSSKTEPGIIDRYGESIAYLEDTGVPVDIVDIEHDRDAAKDHNVFATPLVLVQEDEDESRHLGIVSGLKPLLENDLYGRSLLHQMGFKEGRETAEKLGIDGETDADRVAAALGEFLSSRGMSAVMINRFDVDAATATVRVTPDPAAKQELRTNWHNKLGEFLGGVFTEVFGTGVMATEVRCAQDPDTDACTFTIGADGGET